MFNTLEKSDFLAEVQVSYSCKIPSSCRQKIERSSDAATILRRAWNTGTLEYCEEAYILLLNCANQVLGYRKIGVGGVSGCVVDPKMIFQAALLANASKVVLSHNHPSGNTTPSREDIALTQKIKDAAGLLDMQLLDHIILTAEGYLSFADEGLL